MLLKMYNEGRHDLTQMKKEFNLELNPNVSEKDYNYAMKHDPKFKEKFRSIDSVRAKIRGWEKKSLRDNKNNASNQKRPHSPDEPDSSKGESKQKKKSKY